MELTEFFQYLKNWFYGKEPRFNGKFVIENGQLNIVNAIKTGQYYRIFGSSFNDGVYLHDGNEKLESEVFIGTVRLMEVPKEVQELINDINAWVMKYGGVGSGNMSPFASESFGGYSYSKKAGNINMSWQIVYRDRLKIWKKI